MSIYNVVRINRRENGDLEFVLWDTHGGVIGKANMSFHGVFALATVESLLGWNPERGEVRSPSDLRSILIAMKKKVESCSRVLLVNMGEKSGKAGKEIFEFLGFKPFQPGTWYVKFGKEE